MALTSGTKLGPYEIESPLGAGGMGEVYRARDTRLERTVAIKVLNAQLVASSELRARFEREAKIISQLQHPNICVLHDVGNEGPIDYLVMEFLQGESLAERLRKGPLASEEVLRIAIEIADALEKAHRAGVVHRDLKPGNVMLTKSGAKLLDFGLAKPFGATVASGTGSGRLPSVFAAALTQTMPSPSPATPLSTAGAVIGTVQYMLPEQIQGIEADARSDIFSFGVMLFEMVTGKRTFEGKTQASIVGQILAVDPPSVSILRPETPRGLDRVISLCLDKDPDERIQTAHDLKLQLQAIAEAPLTATQAPTVAPTRRAWLPWAAAGVLALATIAFALAYLQSLRAPRVSVHSYILPPEKATFLLTGNTAGPPVLSPDGLRLAFVAKNADGKQMLWIRPLNSAIAQPMSGTESATYPFWSADSRYVGFFAAAKLNKVDASGGPPQALCDAPSGRGGTWNNTGIIVFAPDTNAGLARVDAAGGTRVALSTLDAKETSHRWPDFLPDGNHFLYFAHGATSADSGIYLAALDSKERKLLLRNDSNALYAAPGYLLFVRDNTLMAQRLNLRSLALEGEAKPVADHVAVNTDTWRSILTASANGELLYQHGAAGGGSQLVWYDASGKPGEPVLPETADYYGPMLSPDAGKLAFALETNGIADIWVVDLARHTKTRITFGPMYSSNPLWWPDGKSIVFSYGPSGGATDSLYRQNADGTGSKEKLLETPGITEFASSVSPDGRYISYMRRDPKSNTGFDIWALPMFPDKSGDQKPFPVVATNFADVTPAFSPDGKWLAYANNETGRMEVYIQPFPSGAGRWQVSTAGGTRPNWRKDGKELFFFSTDQQMMAVDVSQKGASLQLGTPHALFKATTVSVASGPYTVSADGKKFVMNTVLPQSVTEPLTLITNWPADLKQ
ncbi:Serine/threonine protein kinase [Candidatus Sulfotelmatobacter kueseliae]|uniref:Serine/threonine protein kinase n=1 Tax=Candidatus Sulfotelmatobacter kueseliae TaxID=2042962 RepID=A0A2U3L997_9BACT|nr:Serine/threonine protein kinase [Candidatus Sulfotelmatobacter kueseliae]